MFKITDELFRKAYNMWRNRGIGIYELMFDTMFHSQESINSRMERREKELDDGLLSLDCPDVCFDLVFGELETAVDEGKLIRCAEMKEDGVTYYIGMIPPENHMATVFLYSTSYPNEPKDGVHSNIIIYGYPQDDDFDGSFRVSVSSDSDDVKTKLCVGPINNTIMEFLNSLYRENSNNS